MATQIGGLNYYELDFNADGTLSSDGGLPAAVQAGGVQDVFLLSHGCTAASTRPAPCTGRCSRCWPG